MSQVGSLNPLKLFSFAHLVHRMGSKSLFSCLDFVQVKHLGLNLGSLGTSMVFSSGRGFLGLLGTLMAAPGRSGSSALVRAWVQLSDKLQVSLAGSCTSNTSSPNAPSSAPSRLSPPGIDGAKPTSSETSVGPSSQMENTESQSLSSISTFSTFSNII